jgi:hypothetical protein
MSHNVYLSAQSFAKPFLHKSMLYFSVTCLEGVRQDSKHDGTKIHRNRIEGEYLIWFDYNEHGV